MAGRWRRHVRAGWTGTVEPKDTRIPIEFEYTRIPTICSDQSWRHKAPGLASHRRLPSVSSSPLNTSPRGSRCQLSARNESCPTFAATGYLRQALRLAEQNEEIYSDSPPCRPSIAEHDQNRHALRVEVDLGTSHNGRHRLSLNVDRGDALIVAHADLLSVPCVQFSIHRIEDTRRYARDSGPLPRVPNDMFYSARKSPTSVPSERSDPRLSARSASSTASRGSTPQRASIVRVPRLLRHTTSTECWCRDLRERTLRRGTPHLAGTRARGIDQTPVALRTARCVRGAMVASTRRSYIPCDAVPIHRGTLVFHWCCPDSSNGSQQDFDLHIYLYISICYIYLDFRQVLESYFIDFRR